MPQANDDFSSPIYRDPERYDAEHWWKTDDLQFWERMARRHGPRVLELAAGTGRLAPAILDTGAHYTGVDISAPFLDRARQTLSRWGTTVSLVHADIRQFNLADKFDLIFIGFNAFLHLLTDADALAALRHAHLHCHSETRLIIDIFVPDPLFLYRPEGHRVKAMTYTDPKNHSEVTVEETNRYNPENELNQITWYYSTAAERDFLIYEFTMRMIYPDTMDRLLHEAGFEILSKWGDYEESPLDPNSNLQIYVARPGAK